VKLFTHVVFSAGVVLYVCKLLAIPLWVAFILAVMAGLMQYVIDFASHEDVRVGSRTYTRRTPLFHSPLGALIPPVFFTILLIPVLRPNVSALLEYFAVLTLASFSHLLLDLPTGRGIYVGGRRVWKKEKLQYSNPLLNLIFILIGIALIFLGLD